MIRVMEQTAFDSQVIGQKDKSKSILDVWKQVCCFFPVSSSAILFYFLCIQSFVQAIGVFLKFRYRL